MSDPMMQEHPDAMQDQQQIAGQMQPSMEMIGSALQYLDQRISDLAKFVYEDMVGGLDKAYKDQDRSEKLGAFTGRHHERFGPLVKSLSAIDSGDAWGPMFDKMNELGIGEDKEQEFMDMMYTHLDGIKEKLLQSLTGEPAVEAGMDVPEGEGGEPPMVEPAPDASVQVAAEGEPEAISEGLERAADVVKAAPKKKEEEPAVGSPDFFKKYGRGRSATRGRV